MSIIATIGCDLGQKRDPTAIVVTELTAERVGQRRRYVHVVRFLERLALGTPYPDVAGRVAEIVAHVSRLAVQRQPGRAPEAAPGTAFPSLVVTPTAPARRTFRSAYGSTATDRPRTDVPGPYGGRTAAPVLWSIPPRQAPQGDEGRPPGSDIAAGGKFDRAVADFPAGRKVPRQPPRSDPMAATVKLLVDATGLGAPVVDMLRVSGVQPTACYFNHGDRLTANADGSLAVGKGYLVSRLVSLLQGRRLRLPETPEARQLAAELLAYEIRVSPRGGDEYGAFRVGTHDDLVTALGLAVLREPPGFRAVAGGARGAQTSQRYVLSPGRIR